jgi:hypothetical protein
LFSAKSINPRYLGIIRGAVKLKNTIYKEDEVSSKTMSLHITVKK